MGNGTSLGRVRGLGSAHSGAQHWLLQRYTAVGNLLGGLYLAFGLLRAPTYDYAALHTWLHKPLAAVLVALFVVSTFWHARLGMTVLIEDYVHEHGNKFAVMAVLNLLSFAGGAFGLLCIVRIALGS